MQLPVHTFLELSKPHFQAGMGVSNSFARKFRFLPNQDNVTLDPCVFNWKDPIFPYRSHTMKCRGHFGWLSWKRRIFCLCCCPGVPALYQPCKPIPAPSPALLLFQQVSLLLHLKPTTALLVLNPILQLWKFSPQDSSKHPHTCMASWKAVLLRLRNPHKLQNCLRIFIDAPSWKIFSNEFCCCERLLPFESRRVL